MLPSDEEEILGRVEQRFFADESVAVDGKVKSISMPTALAIVLMASARHDIAKGRGEPRRFTRREATAKCIDFIQKHGIPRRRGKTAKEPSEAQWTRVGERAKEKLCTQIFRDPESGADVRFVSWDDLPPLSTGVKAIYCVKPLFIWPPAARPLDPFELGAFILAYAFMPASIGLRYMELNDGFEYVLATPLLAIPRPLQEKVLACLAEPLLWVFELPTIVSEVRAHFREYPFDGALSNGDVRTQWFEIGRHVAGLILRFAGLQPNSESGRVSLVQYVQEFTESLRGVSMAPVDRFAFAAFIQTIRRESFGPEAVEEALNLIQHLSRQWSALAMPNVVLGLLADRDP